MGDFRRTLNANQGAEMAAQGRTIYIKDATAPIQVVFDGSERFLMSQGDKLTRAQAFAGFRIENPRDELLDATITVTDGDYAQRAISGEVTVDDREPLRVIDERFEFYDADGQERRQLSVLIENIRNDAAEDLSRVVRAVMDGQRAGTADANADAIAERALRIGEFADSEAGRIAEAVAAANIAAVNARSIVPAGSKAVGRRILATGAKTDQNYRLVLVNTTNAAAWVTRLSLTSHDTLGFNITPAFNIDTGNAVVSGFDKYSLAETNEIGFYSTTGDPSDGNGFYSGTTDGSARYATVEIASADSPLRLAPGAGLVIFASGGKLTVTADVAVEP